MSKKAIYLASFVVVFVLVVTSDVEAADPDLVGYWKFDETSGTTAYDASGNGQDGTLNGDPQWVVGILGGALEFDGNGDYVDIGNDPIFNITGQITVACWIKVSQFTISWQAIFTMGDDSWRLQRQTTTDNLCWACTGVTGTPGDWWLYGNVNVNDGEWHHAAGVYDGLKYYLYVDGELDVSKDTSGTMSTSSYPVMIGANAQQTGREFEGLIDDVRVYKRALTETEILGVMAGGGAEYPQASGPDPKDGVYHMDTWVNLSWRAGDFADSHDVYFGDNFDDVDAGAESTFQGNQTDTFFVAGFPGFAFPDGLVPGTTYYWRIDEVNEAKPNSPWKGNIWSFTVPPKTAYLPDPVDGAETVSVDGTLSWTPGYGSKLHTVYFGETFDQVDSATGGSPQGAVSYSSGTLKMAKTYYWRVDEFDAVETHKGNIWSFTTEGGVSNPIPAKGAVDVSQIPVLTWTPGLGATYDIYFGADAGTLAKKASGNLGSESYEPGQLEWNTTYYWRVDEANNANADSPWTGPLWSFTTANFLIIDDMEAYNDIAEGEPGSNRIYNVWADGYDDPTNGSQTGHLDPPFYEETIVHGGNKSMPMYYDNTVGKSESTLALTDKRDWTVNGVNTLTIWFRGASDNAAEQMYVTLNSSARVDNDDPDAATKTTWTQWNVDLQTFADLGVNLANVNSITLGLSSVTGGTGKMYFDDIRLYPPEP